MNSFATRDDTLAALERYPELRIEGLPLDFVQGKVPKLLADWLRAGRAGRPTRRSNGRRRATATCSPRSPPRACSTTLLERGYEYLFLSNSDNLGAVLEPRILDWFARERLPFLSEVVDRTEGDRKGGHLARRRDGRRAGAARDGAGARRGPRGVRGRDAPPLLQRNNIWVNLRALAGGRSRSAAGVLGLPMIVNRKTVDPNDPSSPEVLQLETAMGAAIGVFEGAGAVHVPRARFAPVKTTSNLLVVRSDAYELADDWTVRLAPQRDAAPMRGAVGRVQAAARLRGALPGRPALAGGGGAAGGRGRRALRGATWWSAAV